MLVRSHGQAHAAFASRIGVPVAHQNSARPQSLNKFCVRGTDAYEYEVGVARPVVQAESRECLLQRSPAAPYLGYVAFDIFLIPKRLRQHGQSDRIHVVGRCDATHHGHLPRIAGENTDAETRQSVGLGKGARHE